MTPVNDPMLPPPGRPLTHAQAALVRLLAEVAIGQYLTEQDAPSEENTPDDPEVGA